VQARKGEERTGTRGERLVRGGTRRGTPGTRGASLSVSGERALEEGDDDAESEGSQAIEDGRYA
jgi:hypothetical protein